MGLRSGLAVKAVEIVNGVSRRTGKGSGTVIGGRAGLLIDPGLLGSLGASKTCVLVSGTNGKTTTTALLAAALGGDGSTVATNSTGSNMPAGHAAALVEGRGASFAVLECDEAYVGSVALQIHPRVVVLLNLSRDQLDRMSEVRMIADRWRRALASLPESTVVANVDDPLVAFAARDAEDPVWVSGGLVWGADATACPSCGGHITFGPPSGWCCDDCGFSRPEPVWTHDGSTVTGPSGHGILSLALPGAFNRDNALVALAGACAAGAAMASGLEAMATVTDVAGRFVQRNLDGVDIRLMLAKNPAGWTALLDLVAAESAPVVVSINSRTADGADPSWLFDVDFRALAARRVVATGDRWRDLSVRLAYAGVEHLVEADSRAAIAVASGEDHRAVEVIGNYTAFRDLLEGR